MSPRTAKRSTPIVALLTDFGTSDHYVAALKGVIASHNADIRCIDISHTIEPGRVRAAAYLLWAVHADLPPGTVFIAVVDPGVGTDRDILCASVDGRTYLAPDNGLLDMLLASCRSARVFRVSMNKVKSILRPALSTTFHGRDIFAPVGAQLASGARPESIGVRKKFLRPPEWRVLGPSSKVPATVVSVDWFGNIITNIAAAGRTEMKKHIRAVSVGKVMVSVITPTFDEAPDNAPCLVAGSSGLVEIVIKGGNAAEMLRVNDRSVIRVVWTEEPG